MLLIVPALQAVLNTVLYTFIGLVLFAICFFIMEKAMPFSIRKEIEEDQNIALAVVMGSVIIGMAMIIVAAVTG